MEISHWKCKLEKLIFFILIRPIEFPNCYRHCSFYGFLGRLDKHWNSCDCCKDEILLVSMSLVRSCHNRSPEFKGPWLLTYQGKPGLGRGVVLWNATGMDKDTAASVSAWKPDALLPWVLSLPRLSPWVLVCRTISHPLSLLFLGSFVS